MSLSLHQCKLFGFRQKNTVDFTTVRYLKHIQPSFMQGSKFYYCEFLNDTFWDDKRWYLMRVIQYEKSKVTGDPHKTLDHQYILTSFHKNWWFPHIFITGEQKPTQTEPLMLHSSRQASNRMGQPKLVRQFTNTLAYSHIKSFTTMAASVWFFFV